MKDVIREKVYVKKIKRHFSLVETAFSKQGLVRKNSLRDPPRKKSVRHKKGKSLARSVQIFNFINLKEILPSNTGGDDRTTGKSTKKASTKHYPFGDSLGGKLRPRYTTFPLATDNVSYFWEFNYRESACFASRELTASTCT